jgi:tetratricopeptide (TPR) repeat protein
MVTTRRRALPYALLTLFAAFPPSARAGSEPGTRLENVELKTLAGKREKLLSAKAKANVFVFFRPNHARSLDALAQMAACEDELAGKPVRWVAVVSSVESVAEAQATAAQAGIELPVLVDEGDVLSGRLGAQLRPMVGVADGSFVLAALKPYRRMDYCDTVKIPIKRLLGEADEAALRLAATRDASQMPGYDDPMRKATRDTNMARRLLEIGQYNDALKFAQKALAVAPVAGAFTVMGKAYAKLGRCPDALRAFEQALKLDPKDADAASGRSACR